MERNDDSSIQDFTMHQIDKFKNLVDSAVKEYKARGEKPNYYQILKIALVKLYKYDIIYAILMSIVAECIVIFYSFYIGEIIRFLNDPDAPQS